MHSTREFGYKNMTDKLLIMDARFDRILQALDSLPKRELTPEEIAKAEFQKKLLKSCNKFKKLRTMNNLDKYDTSDDPEINLDTIVDIISNMDSDLYNPDGEYTEEIDVAIKSSIKMIRRILHFYGPRKPKVFEEDVNTIKTVISLICLLKLIHIKSELIRESRDPILGFMINANYDYERMDLPLNTKTLDNHIDEVEKLFKSVIEDARHYANKFKPMLNEIDEMIDKYFIIPDTINIDWLNLDYIFPEQI